MAILSFDHLKDTYFEECGELLESAYAQLAALEADEAGDDTVHAMFRAIHSIKGGGGAFGFSRMVAFAHGLESLLDLLRDGKIACDATLLALLTRSTDMLSDLVAAEQTGVAPPADAEAPLLVALAQAASGPLSTETVAQAPIAMVAPPVTLPARYRIHFAPSAEAFSSGNEPLLLIRELMRLGTLQVVADLDRLPKLHRHQLRRRLSHMDDGPRDLRHPSGDRRSLRIRRASLRTLDRAGAGRRLLIQSTPRPIRIAAEAPAPPPEPVAETGEPARRPSERQASQSVRVDTEKVDRLVNLVGELVINQAMLVQLGSLLPSDLCPGLVNGLDTLSQHLRELQEGVMAIRTQPVRTIFLRMPRLMRELSAQLGKDVRLVITGEGTEIDKTVIEQLADPLTHLLRNALDHGIETPDRREAAGKSRQGTIHLGAEHRGGRIVIEVSDDGGGIRRDRVLQRARERGLISAEEQPNDEQIDDMIFLPGFSTAEAVSSVSGRGVGMDVVRRNVQALGGRIAVQSRLGEGSRFLLSLPLTLAIMDGMVVAVGRESYIVPLTNIVESLRPKPSEIHRIAGCGDVVSIRGDYIPLVHLHRDFAIPGAEQDPSRGIVVVVEKRQRRPVRSRGRRTGGPAADRGEKPRSATTAPSRASAAPPSWATAGWPSSSTWPACEAARDPCPAHRSWPPLPLHSPRMLCDAIIERRGRAAAQHGVDGGRRAAGGARGARRRWRQPVHHLHLGRRGIRRRHHGGSRDQGLVAHHPHSQRAAFHPRGDQSTAASSCRSSTCGFVSICHPWRRRPRMSSSSSPSARARPGCWSTRSPTFSRWRRGRSARCPISAPAPPACCSPAWWHSTTGWSRWCRSKH